MFKWQKIKNKGENDNVWRENRLDVMSYIKRKKSEIIRGKDVVDWYIEMLEEESETYSSKKI
jgi:hypothetical protein